MVDIATALPGCIGVAKQEGGVCPNGNGDFRVVTGNSFFFARNADGVIACGFRYFFAKVITKVAPRTIA